MIRYNYTDDVFAFWHDNNTKCKIDINVNAWLDFERINSYLDFGIRFYKELTFEKFFVFVPFYINLKNITDLFESFSYETVISGVFNKNCIINKKEDDTMIELKIGDELERITPLNKFAPTINHCDKGSIVCFNLESIKELHYPGSIYIRWRIPYVTVNNAVSKKWVGNYAIDSPYITNNYKYFIKINEFRSLPEAVKGKIKNPINYINEVFFVLVCKDNIKMDTQGYYKIRKLENDLYNEYKPKDYDDKNTVVYQWHNNQNNYNINIDAELKKINNFSLMIYIIIIIIINIISNLIWDVFAK
ncbi:MAG: hypothetical protein QM644_13090 [Mobilitalea sp.]